MILLTGATGLLGSHIAYELLQQGKKIRALKRKDSNSTLTEKIFSFYTSKHIELLNAIEWVEGDVLDLGSLEDAMVGITHVYHCAAMVSFLPKEKDKMMQVNIEGTANVVNAAMHAGVKKLCHISSIAALGSTIDGNMITEETWWKNNPSNSYYAISKYGAEREVWRAAEEGLNVVIVNPSFIIGPGDTSKSSSEAFGILRKGASWYTNGVNGYVDVRDVAHAAIKLTENDVLNQRFILNAANLSYRSFFDKVLVQLNKPKTKREAGKILLGFAWRIEKLLAAIAGRNPIITKEKVGYALQISQYDGSKIQKTINFNYRNIDTSIMEICKFYK